MEKRAHRKLPSHLVVALVIAMSLWSSDSIAFSSEKFGQRVKNAAAKISSVLASTKSLINYRSKAETGMSGNESVI